ncbi:MAG TPA: hypothetical protein PLG67_05240 [Bacillota bacterium]|nr:hypothetical protein [Bacillota bacterium]
MASLELFQRHCSGGKKLIFYMFCYTACGFPQAAHRKEYLAFYYAYRLSKS